MKKIICIVAVLLIVLCGCTPNISETTAGIISNTVKAKKYRDENVKLEFSCSEDYSVDTSNRDDTLTFDPGYGSTIYFTDDSFATINSTYKLETDRETDFSQSCMAYLIRCRIDQNSRGPFGESGTVETVQILNYKAEENYARCSAVAAAYKSKKSTGKYTEYYFMTYYFIDVGDRYAIITYFDNDPNFSRLDELDAVAKSVQTTGDIEKSDYYVSFIDFMNRQTISYAIVAKNGYIGEYTVPEIRKGTAKIGNMELTMDERWTYIMLYERYPELLYGNSASILFDVDTPAKTVSSLTQESFSDMIKEYLTDLSDNDVSPDEVMILDQKNFEKLAVDGMDVYRLSGYVQSDNILLFGYSDGNSLRNNDLMLSGYCTWYYIIRNGSAMIVQCNEQDSRYDFLPQFDEIITSIKTNILQNDI